MWVLKIMLVAWACASGVRCASSGRHRGAARAGRGELTAQHWTQRAQDAVRRRAAASPARGRARNIVFLMGDGMSVPTMAAARTLLGQRDGRPGEETELEFETFPTAGLIKTYCVDAQVADSACTATAMMAGVKNNEGVLGLTASVPRLDCEASLDAAHHLETIADWALADGRDVGIVTTTRITHASPAAVYAKSPEREWENNARVEAAGFDTERCPDIAHQLVHNSPANKFKVILGGGRREFRSNSTADEESGYGLRTDDRDLIQEWQDDKRERGVSFQYTWNREQLMNVSQTPPEYLLGLFEHNHLQYHLEANKSTEPTLAELTEVAIRSLSRNEKGFFLFVESGRIDHAHHDNLVHLALDETIELSAAVARARALLDAEDSLVVVTADHAHVMAFNGYAARGVDVLGLSDDLDWDDVPYMTLSYTNGPGARLQVNGTRDILENEPNFMGLNWTSHADVPLEWETHGGDDVAVFAWGAHHDMFTGLYEQNQLPHLMAYAGCFGPGMHACDRTDNGNGAAIISCVSVFSLLIIAVIAITQ